MRRGPRWVQPYPRQGPDTIARESDHRSDFACGPTQSGPGIRTVSGPSGASGRRVTAAARGTRGRGCGGGAGTGAGWAPACDGRESVERQRGRDAGGLGAAGLRSGRASPAASSAGRRPLWPGLVGRVSSAGPRGADPIAGGPAGSAEAPDPRRRRPDGRRFDDEVGRRRGGAAKPPPTSGGTPRHHPIRRGGPAGVPVDNGRRCGRACGQRVAALAGRLTPGRDTPPGHPGARHPRHDATPANGHPGRTSRGPPATRRTASGPARPRRRAGHPRSGERSRHTPPRGTPGPGVRHPEHGTVPWSRHRAARTRPRSPRP